MTDNGEISKEEYDKTDCVKVPFEERLSRSELRGRSTYEENYHEGNHMTKTIVYVPTEPETKRLTFHVERSVYNSFVGTLVGFAIVFLVIVLLGYKTVLLLKDEV